MTEQDDRDSGAKPPQPSQLPPRLREKLEEPVSGGPKKSPAGLIVGLMVIIVLAIVGWWFVQDHQAKAKTETERAALRARAVADSVARVRTADSLAAKVRADSIAAFNKLPKWKQRQITARLARPAGGTGVAGLEEERGPFTIDAGDFLLEDKARTAADALKASTNLATRVAQAGAGGSYHIYLGTFDSRAAASKAASDLATKHLVEQASVVPVKAR